MNTGRSGTEEAADPARGHVALVLDGAGWAGTERNVRGLLGGLPALGWRVDLVTCEEGPLTVEARRLGLAVHVLPRRPALAYVLGLRRLLRELRPEVVHAHSGRLACLAGRLAQVPFVVETAHGLPQRRRRLYRVFPPVRLWEAMKSSLCQRTVVVCRADAEYLEHSGRPRGRIREVANGLPPQPLRPREAVKQETRRALDLPVGALLVGLVGRLSPQKAPERFLEVLARILASASPGGALPVLGVVCGDGPELGRLRQEAGRLGLGERILWLGPREGAAGLLPALDLLLLPSLWEGLPYVLLEALQAGTPVLATPVGGMPDVLQGADLSSGCLAWDEAGWTRRAAELLFSDGAEERWAAAARKRADDFPEKRTVEAVDRIYRELLARAPGRC
jgi:glycosyltransferase involved in cell wall biosynthesis